MNSIRNVFATSILSIAAAAAMAAGSPGVEHNTQAFLEALAKGGGKPLETLSNADARAVLVGAQANAQLPAADVSEKTITIDGKPIKLTIVRPVGAKGVLPAFMFFHGGGWILGDFPTAPRECCPPSCSSTAVAGSSAISRRTSASCATWWPTRAPQPCS
jgi:acetyl esterase